MFIISSFKYLLVCPGFEQKKTHISSNGSGSKIFDPGRVGSIFCCSVQARSAIFGLRLGLGLKNFPLNSPPKFIFFSSAGQKNLIRVGSKSTLVKNRSASYLLQVKSYNRVGFGPISYFFDNPINMMAST